MKKDVIEYLSFDNVEEKRKVGRPKLADDKTKKKSLIIASVSFLIVILLLIFGYGTLFGFNSSNLLGTIINNKSSSKKKVLITEIKPLIKDITLKESTARKLYLTILPSSATNKKISYTSSDESIVTVDSNGKILGLSVGNATVTATTLDGTNLSTSFNITVIKNATGSCSFESLGKTSNGIEYTIKCDNAKVKEIQYKINNDDYKTLLTKKLNDVVKLSSSELNKKITFKVIYYPNNSKITKYKTKTINNSTTTKKVEGNCYLTIKDVKANSAKYDITCDNATVNKIAYKIGNGSYVGIDSSSLADTILFEESEVTRVLYFNVDYSIDGSNKIKTITKSSIIEKKTINDINGDEKVE